MAKQLFREKSIERISSPEQLNDYLKVTKPAVWAVLIAVIVLLAGTILWGAFTYIGSKTDVKADVHGGSMTFSLEDTGISADDLSDKMVITVGGESFAVEKADVGKDGTVSVKAAADLDDGAYEATLEYRKTQILSLLFNNG